MLFQRVWAGRRMGVGKSMPWCTHPGSPDLPLDRTDVPKTEAVILMCKRFSPRLASSTPDASMWFFSGPSSPLGGLAYSQLMGRAYL
jgi:hypothetical protein